jgi:hypothetical protein
MTTIQILLMLGMGVVFSISFGVAILHKEKHIANDAAVIMFIVFLLMTTIAAISVIEMNKYKELYKDGYECPEYEQVQESLYKIKNK